MAMILIDCSAWIYASHFRLSTLARSDGLPTGATVGFTSMLWRFLRAPPVEFSHIAACFDPHGPTWRSTIDPLYKANRGAKPGPITQQWALVREAAAVLGVAALEAPGYEADDVLATYARRGKAEQIPVVIVSADKDLTQLLDAPAVRIYDSHPKHLPRARWIDEATVYAKFGVRPRMVPDVQALAGDSTDGYGGIPGVGPKTAGELVGRYGSLEAVIAEARKGQGSFIRSYRVAKLIADHADKAILAKKLATLDRAADIFVPIEDLRAKPPKGEEIAAFLTALESRELRDRILRELAVAA